MGYADKQKRAEEQLGTAMGGGVEYTLNWYKMRYGENLPAWVEETARANPSVAAGVCFFLRQVKRDITPKKARLTFESYDLMCVTRQTVFERLSANSIKNIIGEGKELEFAYQRKRREFKQRVDPVMIPEVEVIV